MGNWKFRKDILSHPINECSGITFQDVEDYLNYFEDNVKIMIEQAFKKGIEWGTCGEKEFPLDKAIDEVKRELLNV